MEFTEACKVHCRSGEIEVTVLLPERLLWSPEGMAELFRLARRWVADPKDFSENAEIADVYEMFHIVSIKRCGGSHGLHILDIDWDDPSEEEK